MSKSTRLFITLCLLHVFSYWHLVSGQDFSNQDIELNDTSSIREAILFVQENFRTKEKESKILAEKIIKASKNITYDKGIVFGYFWLGNVYKYHLHLDSAKKYYNLCLDHALETNYIEYISRVYNQIGNIYSMQSIYDSAILYYKKDHWYCSKLSDTTGIVSTNNNISIVYKKTGQWDSCLSILKENEILIRSQNDTFRLANCLRLQGNIYQNQGNIHAALSYYFDALDQLKTKENSSVFYLTQVNLASLYYDIQEFRTSIKILKSIESGYIKELRTHMTFFELMGKSYQSIAQFDSALYFFNLSLEESTIGNQVGKAAITNRYIGDLLNETGKYTQAVEYLKKSYDICQEKNMVQEKAISGLSLAHSYIHLKRLNSAEKLYLDAIKTGKQLNDNNILKNASKGLHEIYAYKGNYKKAYNYLSDFKSYSDKIISEKNIREITRRDLEYQFDKEKSSLTQQQAKERLLHEESLKRQKLIRNFIIVLCIIIAFVALIIYKNFIQKKKANAEKEILIKEIHHRVKNNLQIISSLLNIQTEYLEDKRIIDAVHESQSRVRAMALIHQLLYQEENFTRINLQDYIQQLTKVLSGIFKDSDSQISTIIEADEVSLDIDTTIPLGLIITELISNSYKYAFHGRENGKIMISFSTTNNNHYELVVSDDGLGLPESINLEEIKSMGLKLVKMLSAQINGTLSIGVKQGTTIKIAFSET